MNDLTVKQLKDLIKGAAIEALGSEGGQKAIVGALDSDAGQNAMVKVLKSVSGQEAIVASLASEKGQVTIAKSLTSKVALDILTDFFVDAFHDVVSPTMEIFQKSISNLQEEISELIVDVNYLKESAVKRDRFIEQIKNKIIRRES